MARRILFIVAALVVLGFLYVGYTSYDAGRSVSSGEVYSNDPPSSKAKSADTSSTDSKSPGQTIVYPTATQSTDTSTPTSQISQPGVVSNAVAPPGSDSITPNPPNGMVFSGTGKYQLYRQGNITWRLDTDNGHTCIIFATDEEWKKPKVFQAGCGKS